MRPANWLSHALAFRRRSVADGANRRGEDVAFKLRDLGQAAALMAVFLLGLVIATLYPTGKDGQYAVVAPPWYSLSRTMALIQVADGRIVDTGDRANMVIVQSTHPDFVRTLYRAGAWLVIDPLRLRGCIGFKSADEEART